MLSWLTAGVYCVEKENGQHASGHTTLGHNVELAFAFAVFLILLLRFVSHGGTVSARAEWSNVYFMSTVLTQWGGNNMWLNMRHEHRTVQKRESCRLCIFALLTVTTTFKLTQSIWFVPRLMLYCGVSRQLFPCCFYYLWLLCGQIRVGS